VTYPAQRAAPLIIYGHDYCGQCWALKSALDEKGVAYEWRDVLNEPRHQVRLKELARGYLSVPTVVFEDGTVMVEPWPNKVLARLRR
jgi:mycoredoxin